MMRRGRHQREIKTHLLARENVGGRASDHKTNFLQKIQQLKKRKDVEEKNRRKLKGARKHQSLQNTELAPDYTLDVSPPLFSSGVNVLEMKAACTGAKAFPLGLFCL